MSNWHIFMLCSGGVAVGVLNIVAWRIKERLPPQEKLRNDADTSFEIQQW